MRRIAQAVPLAALILYSGLGCIFGGTTDNTPVASVEVTPGSGSVQLGKTIQLTATTRDADGNELRDRLVTWHAVSNLVTVSDAGLVTGVAVGGPVQITAISYGVTGTAQVTVTPVAVASVAVTGAGTVKRNYFAQMTAIVKDADGNQLIDRQVSWSSSDPGRATVSGTGLVSGVSEGTATITATSEGKSGSTQISVVPNPVATVSLEPTSASLIITETQTLTATLRDAAGLTLNGRSISWVSSDPGKVTVGQFGPETAVVTAVGEGGPVTITATSEGKSGTAQVTVIRLASAARLIGQTINFTTGQALAGVNLIFQIDGANVASTTSEFDGTFQSPGLPPAPNGVWILANLTGFAQTTIFVANVPPAIDTQTEQIPMVPGSGVAGNITGTVRDARSGLGIPNASLSLNSWLDPAPRVTLTNASGFYSYNGLAPGTYQITATGPGYQATTRTGIAVGNGATTGNQDLVLTAAGSTDVRIVLTWGSSPRDLDSHLTGPTATSSRFHVYYGSRGSFTSAPFAGLDVDDTDAVGPETITITQLVGGNYRYSVHDYSNRSSNTSTALGSSGAKVALYLPNGQSRAFFVPNQPGTLWTVFELSGTAANPVVTPRDDMSFTSDPGGILSPPAVQSGSQYDLELIKRATHRHAKRPVKELRF